MSIKIALLGSSGVGKTCIIKRYTENIFDPDSASTPGASYSQKYLKDKNVNLDLWDTAGQEQYRSLVVHFYKDAFIVCLVYDITNQQSFQELKDFWYKNLKEHSEMYNNKAKRLSEVRLDYASALKNVRFGRQLIDAIKHDFCDKDIDALAAIHKSRNMSRTKIEELLSHLGYKDAVEDFKNKDYDKYLNKDKVQDNISLESEEMELE